MGMRINRRNIRKYKKKYDEDYDGQKDEEKMKLSLRKQRYLNKEEFVKIGMWKSKRPKKYYESNDDVTVQEITKLSFSTKDEKERIESLDSLRGVGYPIASTILHFAFPRKYPIMDFRVIRSLGLKQPSTYKFDFWKRYCKKIQAISKKYSLSIRTVDKALWKYDELNSGRRRTCGQHE